MENVIMQGILFPASDTIMPQDVELKGNRPALRINDQDEFQKWTYKKAKEGALTKFNEAYIGDLLLKCRGNVIQAAKLCGLERQSLQQIMRRYEIKSSAYRKD